MTMDAAILEEVRSAPIFASLTDAQLECIEPGEVIDVPAGTVLINEGDRYTYFLVILAGEIRLSRIYDRQEILMGVMKPGMFTGEITLLLDVPWLASARVGKDARFFRLGQEDFWRMLGTCHAVARQIFTSAAHKMRNVEGYSQQREKLASLGTMAAGLAHELNILDRRRFGTLRLAAFDLGGFRSWAALPSPPRPLPVLPGRSRSWSDSVFGRFFAGPAAFAELLPGRQFAAFRTDLACRLGRGSTLRSRSLSRPRQALGVAAVRSLRVRLGGLTRLGLGPGGLLRCRVQPVAEPVELLGRRGGPGFRFPLLAFLGLGAGIGRAVGHQEAGERGGHVGARGVVLAQEALQRSGRHALQQAPRALVASRAGACKNLRGALAGLQICRLPPRRDRRATADQKRHRR